MKIIKRNGNIEEFNREKIANAVRKALVETKECDINSINCIAYEVANDVSNEIFDSYEEYIEIEDIQDMVEFTLMDKDLKNTAKAYILYRNERNRIRNEHPLDESILGLLDLTNKEVLTENSNKQSHLASTQRDLIAGEVSKYISRKKLIPKDLVEAHDKGLIHLHK